VAITALGFIPLETDPSIYKIPDTEIIVAVYVDDVLIIGPTDAQFTTIAIDLSKQFQMKDLGQLKDFSTSTFFGNQMERYKSIKTTSSTTYMLARFQMQHAHPAKTLLGPSLPLLAAQPMDARTNATQYQELLGSLNHIAVFSRPDISNADSQLSLKSAHRVLRYLHQTRNLSLSCGGIQTFNLLGYIDSDWGGDRKDRKSTTGDVFTLN
jgi:hypothetical protein